MNLKEEFENLPIADLGWIEDDLDRFGMGAVIAVSRVAHIAARIPDSCRHYAVVTAKKVLHAPEATAG
jgi:hypothetical protein